MEMPTNLVINYAYCNGLDEDDEPCPFFLVRESEERLQAAMVFESWRYYNDLQEMLGTELFTITRGKAGSDVCIREKRL